MLYAWIDILDHICTPFFIRTFILKIAFGWKIYLLKEHCFNEDAYNLPLKINIVAKDAHSPPLKRNLGKYRWPPKRTFLQRCINLNFKMNIIANGLPLKETLLQDACNPPLRKETLSQTWIVVQLCVVEFASEKLQHSLQKCIKNLFPFFGK